MMRSLFSGVSGLKSHQTRMDVIGNNVANVNTTGYKSSRTTFADTLSQTMTGASAPTDNLGGTNPKQVGLGTGVASIDTLFTDGSVQSTGKNTDLCLSGNGLFVVSKGVQKFYTRDGAFEFDADGNYVLPGSGMFVQGWTATDGVLNTSGAAGNITIPAGKSMASKVSTKATYSNNLNSSAATIKTITGGTTTTAIKYYTVAADGSVTATTSLPVALTLADGTTPTATSGTYTVGGNYTTSVTSGSLVKNAANTIDLTLADGTKIPSSDLTNGSTYTAGSSYTKTLGASDSVTKSANNTLVITLASGGTATIANGTTYKIGDTNGGSTITGITETSNISQMDYTSAVSKMNAPYVTSSKASATSPVTLTMSDGTTVTETSGTYSLGNSQPITTTIDVFDTLGNKHSIPVYFTKTATSSTTGNTWTVSLGTDDLTAGTAQKASIPEKDGTTTVVSMNNTALQFNTSGKYTSGSGNQATLTLTNGANGTQSITIDLSALTQYSGASTVNGKADGNAAGTLSSVSIDSSGIVTGSYSNGVKQAEAQVAIAQFNNASGLTKTGNSLYQESNNSGTANIKTAGDLGVTITPSALEMSNVDIANEFSDMIITQRGFQSNSKIITVGDEMLETLIGMKR